MDRVHMDILGAPPETEDGNRYVLVIIDQFMHYVEAYPLCEPSAETVASKFVSKFVWRFGTPLKVHTAQGTNFCSQLLQHALQLLQVAKNRMTPNHPSSNGVVEIFNWTLLQMIRCYIGQNQRDWDRHIPLLTAAYRSTPHSRTGFTPNRLMLGRKVRWPADLSVEESKITLRDPAANYLWFRH